MPTPDKPSHGLALAFGPEQQCSYVVLMQMAPMRTGASRSDVVACMQQDAPSTAYCKLSAKTNLGASELSGQSFAKA